MYGKSLLKAALVIAIALAMVLPASAAQTKTRTPTPEIQAPSTSGRDVIFNDSFETYDDFLIDFPPWTNIDVDGADSFGHSLYTWENQWLPQAFIVFNPYSTSPPMAPTEPAAMPHTGNKYAAAFNDNSVGYVSDDWLITPQITASSWGSVNYWAKSYSSQYNLEQLEIGVSTTDPTPEAMTIVSPVTSIPLDWTPYTADISSYSGNIYVGFHFCSVDSWFLLLDDVEITGSLEDLTDPVTAISLSGTSDTTTVTLTATDDSSGVAYTTYKLDDGAWTNYTTPFDVTDLGEHTIQYYSVDNAGNQEGQKSQDFTVPILSITIKGGIGISLDVINGGTTTADLSWDIKVSGLVFPKAANGIMSGIEPGASGTAKAKVFGIGPTTITATVNGIEKTAKGLVLVVFVLGVK